MSLTRPFLLSAVFLRTGLPCSYGYHLERGGMTVGAARQMRERSGRVESPGTSVGVGCRYMCIPCKKGGTYRCQLYALRGLC